MRQLVVLSGKGGTGKTSVVAAFAHLAAEQSMSAVLADADVDAANLALVLDARSQERHDFIGGATAVIDPDLCSGCGTCAQVCRFDAVVPPLSCPPQAVTWCAGAPRSAWGVGTNCMTEAYHIDPIACEGCAACVYACPCEAISLAPQLAGEWIHSESRCGPLFHAALRPAQENSGKLVTLVKQQARLWALDHGYRAIIVDGPPGIGCPVISAISGADLALVVAEPTAAGIHDLKRALGLAAHFRVPAWVCINKADVYPEGAAQIEDYCRQTGIDIVGRIPFDATVTEAMVRGQSITAYRPDAPASQAIRRAWEPVGHFLSAGEQPNGGQP